MSAPSLLVGRDRGFILVGVVMFTLALTIVGLSLFALSGYEAGFFTDAHGHAQALYDAEGGQVIVQSFLSTAPTNLQNAHLAEGQNGVVSAIAWQLEPNGTDTTSFGPMNWDSTVFIRVTATHEGQTRTVQGRFIARKRNNSYKFLLAARGPITYNTLVNGTSRLGTTTFTGQVLQPWGADTAWKSAVNWNGGPAVTRDSVALPLVSGFITQHQAAAIPLAIGAEYDTAGGKPWDPNTQNRTLTLDTGSPTGSGFFVGPPQAVPDPGFELFSPGFDFYEDRNLAVQVRGTAVWMIPAGVRFEQSVTVSAIGGSSPATLVIVAGRNGRFHQSIGGVLVDYTNYAAWIFGDGLRVASPNVSIFIVSDATVALEDFSGGNTSFAPALNVVGSEIVVTGPASPKSMTLTYDPTSMDPLVDTLQGAGLLPPLSGSVTNQFALVRASWLEP